MATRRKATSKTKRADYHKFFCELPPERQAVHLGVLARFILALSVDADRAKAALDKAHKERFGNEEEPYDIDLTSSTRMIEAERYT